MSGNHREIGGGGVSLQAPTSRFEVHGGRSVGHCRERDILKEFGDESERVHYSLRHPRRVHPPRRVPLAPCSGPVRRPRRSEPSGARLTSPALSAARDRPAPDLGTPIRAPPPRVRRRTGYDRRPTPGLPGHFPPLAQAEEELQHRERRRALAAHRRHPRERQPARGCPPAPGRGPQRVARGQHRRLLQRHLDALRHPGRLLHGREVPDDVRRAQIRVSVGGRRPREETHRVQRPQIRRLPPGVGGATGG